MKNPELDSTMVQILNYLESHPKAADTKRGIVRWWLKQQLSSDNLLKMELALKQLVKLKLIEKWPIIGGECIYRSLSTSVQDDG